MRADWPAPLRGALRSAAGSLLDLVVPKRCALCARFDTLLCERCAAGLAPALPPRCDTCWRTRDPSGRCRDCASLLVHSLDGVRAVYELDDDARRLVHMLKYEGISALGEPMGRLMHASIAPWGIRPDVVTAVPLHRSRQRQRGYNQAALLARILAEHAGLPQRDDLLVRTRRTAPQARAMNAATRRENVAGAFAAASAVVGRTILVIDDVCTTAATLRACADALRAAGARRVYGLTFAHG